MLIMRDPRIWRISRILVLVAVVWCFTVLQLWHTHPTGQLIAHLKSPNTVTTDVAGATGAPVTPVTKTPEPAATETETPPKEVIPVLKDGKNHGSSGGSDNGDDDKEEEHSIVKQPQRQYTKKLAKVSMLYYENVTDDSIAYEAAIDSHLVHNERFNYQSFVLRHGILDGYYTKPAYILSILIQELQKPVGERLEWLVWHDADLVLMNSQIPLETFLPPAEFSHINMIVTNDLNGLNNGVFFIRVHEWCITILAASMAYKTYHPDFSHVSEDQAALDHLIKSDAFKGNVTHVPQKWFNSYHNFGIDDDIPPEWHWYNHYFEAGWLLVHFPGTGTARKNLINEWVKARKENLEKYDVPFEKTGLKEEVEKFWREDAPREEEIQKQYWRYKNLLDSVGSKSDRARDRAVDEVKKRMKGQPMDKINQAVEEKKQEHKGIKIENLRAAEAGKLNLLDDL
ncbi:hypothetical protein AA313_de0202730 [Arthrobotrys entomopaga]|nr:hypothetical protein AA313_de0202730 [Arthrobotrys entomopaga]